MTQHAPDTFDLQAADDAVETVSSTPDDIAHVLAGHHGAHLRYVAAWKAWLVWDGMRWRRDRTKLVDDLVRQTGRIVARDVGGEIEDAEQGLRLAQKLVSPASLAATERLARSDRRLAAEPSQWDTDPDRLNTPAGIVDTATGALSPHDPAAHMTRITAAAPAAPGTPHPLWSRFLDRVTSGDADLAFYLQRVAGYALTGHAGEQALFFAHGTGANGKSVFLGTLARILGDYADVTALDVLAAGSPARAAAELGRLDGARLVTVADGSERRPWPLARLKALTDGMPLPARANGGAGAVTPRFKLMLAGNEKPNLVRVDEAVRRRLHLVPFAVTIPEDERDPLLMRKLEAEHPAILRWAIDGALAWRKLGLSPPPRVRDARDRYCAAEDVVGQWLDVSTARSGTAWTASADLYASWCAWARRAGEQPGSQKGLSLLLEARGLEPKRLRTGARGFAGVRLDGENASSRVIAEREERANPPANLSRLGPRHVSGGREKGEGEGASSRLRSPGERSWPREVHQGVGGHASSRVITHEPKPGAEIGRGYLAFEARVAQLAATAVTIEAAA